MKSLKAYTIVIKRVSHYKNEESRCLHVPPTLQTCFLPKLKKKLVFGTWRARLRN